jgi:hypothetical protein
MKVIFLDIDGVLNVIPQGRDEFGSLFHKEFMDNLKWIIDETNAKIVISSSWRHDGLKTLQEMWKKRGIAGEVIDVTPTYSSKYYSEPNYSNLPFRERLERGFEIQDWLASHNDVDKFVIIDDDDDMLESQMSNFVRTSENFDHPDMVDWGYGLTKKCAEQAINILKGRKKETKCDW